MPAPSTEGEWSPWFNMDRPWMGDGDIETLQSIEEEVGSVCGRRHYVEATQCKLAKVGEVFTELTASGMEDKLHVACTDDGLLCLNAEQKPRALECHDYSIRFFCVGRNDSDVTDTKNSFFPQFDVRIYIILAVVPILIFLLRLLWAFLFRRRRRLRRQARRNRNHQDDDNSSISSSVAHAPPTYRELFGELGTSRANANSIFAITRSNIPVCPRCKESQCCVAKATQRSSAFLIPPEPHNLQGLNRSLSVPSNISLQHESQNSLPRTDVITNNIQRQASVPILERLSTSISTISTTTNSNSPVTITTTTTSTNTTVSHNVTSNEERHVNETPGVDNSEVNDQNSFFSTVIQIDQDLSSVFQFSRNEPPSTSSNAPGCSQSSFLNSHDELVLTAANTSNSFYGISQPCPCACHRTVSIPAHAGSVGGAGYQNAGFYHENETTAQFTGMHHSAIPGLQRVWSTVSMGSIITLSELPSYEDALDLIKKKEQKQINQTE